MIGYIVPHQLGDTEADIIAALKALPGGANLASKFVALEALIKAKAKEGAEEAIPDVKAAVAPYVYASLAMGGLGLMAGIYAIRSQRRGGMHGAGVGGIFDFLATTKCVKRVNAPARFDRRSFRTVKQGKARVLVGCPKGHWRGGRCQVGTMAYEVITAPVDGQCPYPAKQVSKYR